MPEIKQFMQMENPCYMEVLTSINRFSANFRKGKNDPEYERFVIKNSNNVELYWD